MRKILILPIVAVSILALLVGCKTTNDETLKSTPADISISAIHDYSFVYTIETSEEIAEEMADGIRDNDVVSSDTDYDDDYEQYIEEDYADYDGGDYEQNTEEVYEYYDGDSEQYIEEDYTDYISREKIITYAYENYGVSEEWTMWLIGTTWREDYHADRYLEYAWACEIINTLRYASIWDLDCIWGEYYSIGNAYAGYYSADDTCLEMVWEALTNTDTRIVEVDGMIRWDVPGYYLIYDSDVYNCQVWGQ